MKKTNETLYFYPISFSGDRGLRSYVAQGERISKEVYDVVKSKIEERASNVRNLNSYLRVSEFIMEGILIRMYSEDNVVNSSKIGINNFILFSSENSRQNEKNNLLKLLGLPLPKQ